MDNNCKRCLLFEAGQNVTYSQIQDYIKTIDASEKVSDEIYNYRLSMCKKCDSLISGMCLKCGCYVEVRAILKNKDCTNFDDKKW